MNIETIYVIDDSDDEHFLNRIAFERERVTPALRQFYSYEEFRTGSVADGSFDPLRSILVVDLNLGSVTGIEAIRALRSGPRGDELIAGICTGSEDPADQLSAYEAGADYFTGKPFGRQKVEDICAQVECLQITNKPGEPLAIVRTGQGI